MNIKVKHIIYILTHRRLYCHHSENHSDCCRFNTNMNTKTIKNTQVCEDINCHEPANSGFDLCQTHFLERKANGTLRCTKCRTNMATKGQSWCLSCYNAHLIATGHPKCSRCNNKSANPGYSWCQDCYITMMAYDQAVGMCTNCHKVGAEPLQHWCKYCAKLFMH